MANCYLVQEDGFRFTLETGDGFLLLEECFDVTAAAVASGRGKGVLASMKRNMVAVSVTGDGFLRALMAKGVMYDCRTTTRGRTSSVSVKGLPVVVTLGGSGVTDIVSIHGRIAHLRALARGHAASAVHHYGKGFAVLSGRGKGAILPELYLPWVDLWLDRLPRELLFYYVQWPDLWVDQLPRVVTLFDLDVNLDHPGEMDQTH